MNKEKNKIIDGEKSTNGKTKMRKAYFNRLVSLTLQNL